ncbi:hypothetical protein GA0111570_103341 [Raineyella antarctica]|uniref:Uncharacterized protein n=1 Tax=Raineyella antarctica TaxID=1577474 RepID=A0A1G6GJ68_9ACTN|nr:hypothetical protein [Raineyella antarctica]SDB81775.1 hypothetical protein GA0111570_103341 [Raineyella antarctica]
MPLDIPQELAAVRARAAEFDARREQLIASPVAGRRRDLNSLDQRLGDLIGALALDPCDASPQVPLVLLPVRVECKLRPGTRRLRIRITPDEVHVDSLVRSLTTNETEAGQAYWRAIWADRASVTAWPDLVEATGGRRAAWVAHATSPGSLDVATADALVFPGTPAEVAHGTVARCLPDRFVVRVFPAGGAPITASGAPVARDLALSPIAFEAGDDLSAVGDLTVPLGTEWTVSFDEAVKVGLGVEVDLPAGTTAIDRIVVVGTRNSVAEDRNADDLAQLLESHRFTDGLSLLPVGTPTNNADADRSPYRPHDPISAPPVTPAAPSSGTVGVGQALGLDPTALEPLVEEAGGPSTLEETQRAANTALWFVTWESALRPLADAGVPGVTPATIEAARRVHRDDVRGAGHAPAVRIGAQPYGLLPVTDLQAWQPRDGDLTATLVPVVRNALARWLRASDGLPHVRAQDDVSDDQLLEMLGTAPFATGIRARPAVDGTLLRTYGAAAGLAAEKIDADINLKKAILAQYSVAAARLVVPPSLHDSTRLLALPLVSDRDAAVVADILAGNPPQVDSILQALLDLAWSATKDAGPRTAPAAYVSPLLQLIGAGPDVAHLVEIAQAEDAAATDPGSFFAAADRVRAVRHFADQPTGPVALEAIEPVAESRTSLAQVALDLGDTPEARWIGQNAIAGLLDWWAVRAEVRQAMTALAAAPLEERRTAVAQALDIASHRVDAWATGIAHARQRQLAAATPTGMTLGAFGYLEGITLGQGGGEPAGWLQAPSTSHAVAAGMLASAHRSQIGARPGTSPFAIDLSSRRGAALRGVLEGINAGQSIGALIGYQVERGLTGSAARFQLTLRELAPLHTDDLNNEIAEADRTSRIAAADVVDGVALLRMFPVEGLAGNAAARDRIGAAPQNAYIQPGTWAAMTPEEWNTIVAALTSAADTLDAVSDALLSESVLQYATGNDARASTAMDAMSTGAAVDPDLGILGVRQAGAVLNQAMIAVIPKDGAGWSTTRPRAVAEPRLEAWAAHRLGSPADIVVAEVNGTRHTLDEAGIAALDLVFAHDVPALGRELRRLVPALGDTPLAETRSEGWPAGAQPLLSVAALAGTLRTIAAGSSPVLPPALVENGAPPERSIDTAEIIDRATQLADALSAALTPGQAVVQALDTTTLAVEEAQVAAVQDAVAGLAAFGADLTPNPEVPTDVAWAWGAWNNAAAALAQARAHLTRLQAGPDAPTTAQVLDAANRVAATILGDDFRMLPLLDPGPADTFRVAVRTPAFPQPPASRLSAFVRDHATVLPGATRLAEAQLLGGALGHPIRLRAVQLTHREGGVPAPGTDRWIAGPLPDDAPWPADPATHLVVELVGDEAVVEGSFAALNIESWTEALPFQPGPRAFDPAAGENPLRAARATTGLAIHAHQASARAPQVILSAVSPDGRRWTTDSVVGTVLRAVQLARARLVTYEHVPGEAGILPAITVASPWLQPRKGFDFSRFADVEIAIRDLPFITEAH